MKQEKIESHHSVDSLTTCGDTPPGCPQNKQEAGPTPRWLGATHRRSMEAYF